MIGACACALLRQGEQLEQGGPGECCAQAARVVRTEAGGLDREAQAHEATIAHEDVAGLVRRVTDRHDGEAPTVERMGGVGYLDLLRGGRQGVVEQGIMLLVRSTVSRTTGC
jgi:hypothetical protein